MSHPRAGQPAEPGDLVDVAHLVTAYFADEPDPAEVVSGKAARDLGLVTSLDSDPVAAALEMAEQLKGRSPDQLAAAKRLFDDTWTAGPRYTFFRERVEQAWLLAARNTAVARKAAFARVVPEFGPRGR